MSNPALDDQIDRLARWLTASQRCCIFTGAGISTESGIPDFRSPGGVWAKNRTVYFDDYCRDADERFEYWRQKSIAHAEFSAATPNLVHTSIVNLEARGFVTGVITQNIDGLHEVAGSNHVLALHGTARRVSCLTCNWSDDADPWVQEFLDSNIVPECPECAGLIKQATISFGQSLDAAILQSAVQLAEEADLFLALGSSLVVEPAASLPRIAGKNGARLVIVNRDATPLDSVADLVISNELGEVFRRLMRHQMLPPE